MAGDLTSAAVSLSIGLSFSINTKFPEVTKQSM